MFKNLVSMLTNEDGATLVEYALIVSIVAVGAVIGLHTLSANVNTTLNDASAQMQ